MKWNEQQEWDGGEGVTVEVKVQVSFKILGSVLESSCKDAGDGRGHREGVTGTRLEGRTRRKATMLREVRERPPLQARRFTRMGPITCPIALHGLFSGASWGAPQLIPTRPTLQEIIQSALTGGQGPSGLRQPNPDSKGGGLFWRESRTLTPKRPPGWTTTREKKNIGVTQPAPATQEPMSLPRDNLHNGDTPIASTGTCILDPPQLLRGAKWRPACASTNPNPPRNMATGPS
jgi:hypothetical protein